VDDPQYHLLPRLYRAVVWNPVRGLPVYRGLGGDDFARLHEAFFKKLRLVRMLFDAGARLHLGTDVQQPFVVPGASLIEEMKLFAQAGIGAGSICRLATRGAAEYLDVADLGVVRAGALADLGVYERDPTRDLAALATLRAVVSRGALLDKAALDARLDRERRDHEGFFFDHVAPLLARLELWRTTRHFVN
jgi:adenine deaminase